MGPASAPRAIGVGYVVEARSPVVQIRREGTGKGCVWHVCRKETRSARWIEIVAEVKTKEMAELLQKHLRKNYRPRRDKEGVKTLP